MATITLKYDSRNKSVKKLLDSIIDLGLATVENKKTGLDEALEDVTNGRVYKAKNAKDLIKSCLR